MIITKILHVGLLVEDTKRALRFYHEVLGLEIDSSRPDLGYPGAWLQVGEQRIHLLELPQHKARQERSIDGGRDHHLALQVSDIEGLKSRLEMAGATYTLSKSGRSALFCRDPDGNAIELSTTV